MQHECTSRCIVRASTKRPLVVSPGIEEEAVLKRARAMDDCIAMLGDELQKKLCIASVELESSESSMAR
jgi:hypothetical protein